MEMDVMILHPKSIFQRLCFGIWSISLTWRAKTHREGKRRRSIDRLSCRTMNHVIFYLRLNAYCGKRFLRMSATKLEAWSPCARKLSRSRIKGKQWIKKSTLSGKPHHHLGKFEAWTKLRREGQTDHGSTFILNILPIIFTYPQKTTL